MPSRSRWSWTALRPAIDGVGLGVGVAGGRAGDDPPVVEDLVDVHDPARLLGDPQDQVVVLGAVVPLAEAADRVDDARCGGPRGGRCTSARAAARVTSPACGTGRRSGRCRRPCPRRSTGSRRRRAPRSPRRCATARGARAGRRGRGARGTRRARPRRASLEAATMCPLVSRSTTRIRASRAAYSRSTSRTVWTASVVDEHQLPVVEVLGEDRLDGVAEDVERGLVDGGEDREERRGHGASVGAATGEKPAARALGVARRPGGR